MNKIQKLPLLEVQKIAAGEVIERPLNIIKELVENSIDASASSITIDIKDGGLSSIKVVDNGSGMSFDDAKMCCAHHATSKISSVDDLQTLVTFGFRGEALASISAISKCTIITRTAYQETALKIFYEGGIEKECTEVAHAVGTEVIIEDVFFNLPARKKFIKSVSYEQKLITQLVQAFCFAYPSITFKYYVDNKEIYICLSTDTLRKRAAQLIKLDELNHMLDIEIKEKNFSIRGILSDHQVFRYDRSNMFMFVNNRWIKNQHLVKAIMKGYNHIIPDGKFPLVCIYIDVLPEHIDVNVHPRKQEVQFLHQQAIDHALSSTIQEMVSLHVKKLLDNSYERSLQPSSAFTPTVNTILQNLALHDEAREANPYPHSSYFNSTPYGQLGNNAYQAQTQYQQELEKNDIQETSYTQKEHTKSALFYNILGQLHATYILAQHDQGFIIIDQHAAHERILYEHLKNNFTQIASTKLIFPHVCNLTADEHELCQKYQSVLLEYGIEVEHMGSHTYAVRAMPVILKNAHPEHILRDLLNIFKQYQAETTEAKKIITEKIHAQMACKGSVKAGDILTPEHMDELLTQLSSIEHRQTCPHGRPTTWFISLDELEKKFKRKL